MSELLWTDERINKQLGVVSDAQIDYASSFNVGLSQAIKVCHSIRDEYEARIAELEAQLAKSVEMLPVRIRPGFSIDYEEDE